MKPALLWGPAGRARSRSAMPAESGMSRWPTAVFGARTAAVRVLPSELERGRSSRSRSRSTRALRCRFRDAQSGVREQLEQEPPSASSTTASSRAELGDRDVIASAPASARCLPSRGTAIRMPVIGLWRSTPSSTCICRRARAGRRRAGGSWTWASSRPVGAGSRCVDRATARQPFTSRVDLGEAQAADPAVEVGDDAGPSSICR